jgi:hypothetical protein
MDLDDTQQVQKHKNDHDDEQDVNGIARAGDASKDIRSKIAKQPQDEQDYDDPGKHEISPFI